MAYPAAMEELVREFEKLPGIGPRTAERLAYHVVRGGEAVSRPLAHALEAATTTVNPCSVCYHLSDQDPCKICADPQRDDSRILVVEQPKDLEALEKAGWSGRYHVLLGTLTRQDGMRSDRGEPLTLRGLGQRLKNGQVKEVVLGTNPDLEGDGTALTVTDYVSKVTGGAVKVSRLARGVPTGAAIEYTNPAVLAEALSERRSLEGEA